MAAGDSAKADQIAFHIYTKLFHVVHVARASEQESSGKSDKWFNLETPLAAPGSTPTSELDAYRALSSTPALRPLVIQVVLAVPPPGGGTALVHTPSRTRVEPEPRFVLLEEWVLSCTPPAAVSSSAASTSSAASDTSSASTSTSRSSTDDTDILPPTIYKNTIPLFRALYSLLRILPAWRVVRKLTGRRSTISQSGATAGTGRGRGLRVLVRLRPDNSESMPGGGGLRGMGGNGNGNEETTLGFGESPSSEMGAPPLPTATHVFPGIAHPAGTLSVSATYLTTPSFTLESLEALLSSRFAVLDAQPASGMGPTMPYNTSVNTSFKHPRSDIPSPSGSRFPDVPRMPLGSARAARTREVDEDEDFLPTLARRSISTSATTSTTSIAGAAVPPSPIRHTMPLPLPGASGSPGRYTSVFHARQRTDSQQSQLRSVGAGAGTSTGSEASYRMGVHIAGGSGAGYRRDSAGRDVVDRFVLPLGGSPSSVPSSLGLRGSLAEGTEYDPYGRGGVASDREREREREKGVPISGGGGVAGAGSSISGSGSGPSAATINPFKSNTLSRSSLSGSLLRGVAGSPGRPTSAIAAGFGGGAGVAFPQPGGLDLGGGSLGSGGGSAAGSVGGQSGGGEGRRRYSSQFTHRYSAAAGSSVGSGGSESGSTSGSLGLAGRERGASGSGAASRSGSFPKTTPAADQQQDDISTFVKDIDAARPLLGRFRHERQPTDSTEQDEDEAGGDARLPPSTGSGSSSSPDTSRGGTVRGSTSTAAATRTVTASAFDTPSTGAMLTSASEVDERLRQMNEEFKRSLVGLGQGGRGGSRASPLTHSPVSTSSGSGSGGDGQGSEEVIGRLEFDFDGPGR